ncbi:MAG TPA: M67 family metallopeptidase [Thermomicrobiales bacterium]
MSQTAQTLHLPRSMREEIIAHARAESPRECCGVIAGQEGQLIQLFRLTNVAPGNTRYEVAPEELYRLERDFMEKGWEVAVIYHSHPATRAYPSETDVNLAFWPDAVYLICSLADPEAPDLRAFRIVDGQISEVTIAEA